MDNDQNDKGTVKRECITLSCKRVGKKVYVDNLYTGFCCGRQTADFFWVTIRQLTETPVAALRRPSWLRAILALVVFAVSIRTVVARADGGQELEGLFGIVDRSACSGDFVTELRDVTTGTFALGEDERPLNRNQGLPVRLIRLVGQAQAEDAYRTQDKRAGCNDAIRVPIHWFRQATGVLLFVGGIVGMYAALRLYNDRRSKALEKIGLVLAVLSPLLAFIGCILFLP